MLKDTMFVGLDVHKTSITVAVSNGGVMGQSVTHKVIAAHRLDGRLTPGEEFAIRPPLRHRSPHRS